MNATIDLTNRVINGLFVIGRVSLSAANPRWRTRCERCESESTWDHAKLINAMQTSSGQVARCTYSNCSLGQAGLKPNKIMELEPILDAPIVTQPKQDRELGSKPLVTAVSRPKSKDELLYDKVCKSRFYFDNQPVSFRDFLFAKENMPRIWNRMEAEIDAWQEATATGGNI
jgi:hypothetical protein